MMTRKTILFSLLMLGLVACGGDAGTGSPPAISDLDDQRFIQNMLTGDTSLSLPFTVSDKQDPASDLKVTAEVLGDAAATVSCEKSGECTLNLEVTRTEASSSAVTVTVQDTDAQEASSSLNLTVAPRLVESAADSGTASLRETIAEADAGDVIAFDGSGEFASEQRVELSTQLTIVKDLVIQGPGTDKLTLGGAGTHRIFNVKESTVSLSGMTLTNGLGQDGNASKDRYESVGGAIANRSMLTLKDVVVSGNKADYGGAIYNAAGAELTITDSILGGEGANEASRSGGALFNEGALTLSNVTLSANKAGRYGGALYNYEKDTVVTIENSRLIGNEAQSSSAIVNGFLVCQVDCDSRAGSLTIRDSEISNNRSTPVEILDGNGALSNFGPLDIYNSRFEKNESPSGSALYNHFLAVALLDETTFSDNISSLNAGAIYNEGTLTLQNGTAVTANAAANSGGGIFNEQGNLIIGEGNSVTGNKADSDSDGSGTGGGVYSSGGSTTIAEGVVINNLPNDVVSEAPPASQSKLSGISHRP